jgi:hypothetical protein
MAHNCNCSKQLVCMIDNYLAAELHRTNNRTQKKNRKFTNLILGCWTIRLQAVREERRRRKFCLLHSAQLEEKDLPIRCRVYAPLVLSWRQNKKKETICSFSNIRRKKLLNLIMLNCNNSHQLSLGGERGLGKGFLRLPVDNRWKCTARRYLQLLGVIEQSNIELWYACSFDGEQDSW